MLRDSAAVTLGNLSSSYLRESKPRRI
nr:unnamed protein product [Callosobruchus chinensis]